MKTMSTTTIPPKVPMDILLVEDRDDQISAVETAIEESKLTNRMVVARRPAEALVYLRQCASGGPLDDPEHFDRPGLILLDVNMSDKRGFDILHDLRTDPSLMTIPVVILTDSLEEVDMGCTMAHGVTGYFLKPMDPRQLKKVIKDVEEHWTLLMTPACAN